MAFRSFNSFVEQGRVNKQNVKNGCPGKANSLHSKADM